MEFTEEFVVYFVVEIDLDGGRGSTLSASPEEYVAVQLLQMKQFQ